MESTESEPSIALSSDSVDDAPTEKKEEIPPKSRQRTLCVPILCSLAIFLTVIFLVSLVGLLIFVLMLKEQIFLNPDKIYLPEGTKLYEMTTLTYDEDNQLYRSTEPLLLVLPDEEADEEIDMYEDFVTDGDFEDEEGVTQIVTSLWEEEMQYNVQCEGTCKCYEENFEDVVDRRTVATAIYSKEFASVVVVSALGWAAARFVNNHEDECYDAAKESLGWSDEDMERGLLSCSMSHEDVECDDQAAQDEKLKELENSKMYQCRGSCLTRNDYYKYQYPCQSEAAKQVDCAAKDTGWHDVLLNEIQRGDPTEDVRQKEWFRSKILHPFCNKFLVPYEFRKLILGKDSKAEGFVHPCTAKGGLVRRNMYKNIECVKRPI